MKSTVFFESAVSFSFDCLLFCPNDMLVPKQTSKLNNMPIIQPSKDLTLHSVTLEFRQYLRLEYEVIFALLNLIASRRKIQTVYTVYMVHDKKLSQLCSQADDHEFVPKLPGDESSDEETGIEARGSKRSAEEPVDDLRKSVSSLNTTVRVFFD